MSDWWRNPTELPNGSLGFYAPSRAPVASGDNRIRVLTVAECYELIAALTARVEALERERAAGNGERG